MDNPACREIKDQLEAYALGALDENERARVEAHLAGCDSCRRVADELRDVAHALPGALAAASTLRPPELLKQRLLRTVYAEPPPAFAARPTAGQESRRRGSWLRPRPAAAALVVAVAALSLAWNVHLSNALSQERSLRERLAQVVGHQEVVLEVVDSKQTRRALLLPPQGSRSRAYGKLFTRPDSRFVVAMAARLPQPPSGRSYHLWLTQNGRTRRAGEMTVTRGFTLIVLRARRPGPVYDRARVTLQPAGPGPEAKTAVLEFDRSSS
jgi:hypothetical protein